MKARTKHITRLIRETINKIDPDTEVILYGSRARGDEKSESDWDILILTDYPVDLNREQKFREQLYELELKTEEPFSVFVYSKEKWNTKQRITPFYDNINQEGIHL